VSKVIVFAGTSEGRKICELLAENNIDVTACVATKYGAITMPKIDGLKVKEGRLNINEITNLIKSYDLVIDATHPYAEIISENIKIATSKTKKEYLRIIRPSIHSNNVIRVESIEEACTYLNETTGNVLITTGSKKLEPYTKVIGYEKRLYFRFLPTIEAISNCEKLGIKPTNIICMQGPFSKNINVAMLEQINGKYLVTKESGSSGGFLEKLEGAKQLGVKVILIGKPCEEEGYDLERACKYLKKNFSIKERKYSHFPLFIDISNKKIIVVGGGKIASRRVSVLNKFGANITVISPEISDTIKSLYEQGEINVIKKTYTKTDLIDAYMVIGATNNREVNERIKKDGQELKILTNIIDKKEDNDFFFPAIFSDEHVIGGLISNNGNNHHLVREKAAKIRSLLNSDKF